MLDAVAFNVLNEVAAVIGVLLKCFHEGLLHVVAFDFEAGIDLYVNDTESQNVQSLHERKALQICKCFKHFAAGHFFIGKPDSEAAIDDFSWLIFDEARWNVSGLRHSNKCDE